MTAGVRGRQPHTEELEGHRHLSAGDRGGLLAHHHVCSGPHTRYVGCLIHCCFCDKAVRADWFDWSFPCFPSGASWQQQVQADRGRPVQTGVQHSRPRGHVDQR